MTNKFKSGCFYHIFNKSIAGYHIFKDNKNVDRFIKTFGYYNCKINKTSFSLFLRRNKTINVNLWSSEPNSIVKFLSFCIMPDHYHFLVKSLTDEKISKYISDAENSFTRYFNIRNNRKGPLWQSRFRSTIINNDAQLLHVSRYVHLNPTTNNLVDNPEDWKFSSYRLIVTDPYLLKNNLKEISISNRFSYRRFVENNMNYQRRLKQIRKLILE